MRTLCLLLGSAVVMAACRQVPTTGSDARSYRGVYETAFEVSSLTPCETSERWWVTAADLEVAASLERALGSAGSATAVRRVYVEVEGDRTPRGQFGHLGGYVRELRVTRVVEAAPVAAGQCE